jgi:hypothetical protein
MPVEVAPKFGYWRDPLFLGSLGLYAVNRGLIKPHLHHYSPLFHGHLDDTLTAPVALPLFLFAYRLLRLRPDDAPPRWWEVALHLGVWEAFFKWFGPLRLHRGAFDPVDMVCIALGGGLAWLFWQRQALARRFRISTVPPGALVGP